VRFKVVAFPFSPSWLNSHLDLSFSKTSAAYTH